MRKKRNSQTEFDFQPASLGVTQEYFERYDRISRILDENPKILDLVHADLKKTLKRQERSQPGRDCVFTTDNVLRIILCQIIENESLRRIVVRIDDSNYLRRFARIYNGPMMDFTTLCTLKNAIKPKTWKKINKALAQTAVEEELICGEKARLDTTACETNIHWPTDSSLLWDSYRVIARLVDSVRELDPEVVDDRRLQVKKAKKLHSKIARRSGKKGVVSKIAKKHYKALLDLVRGILEWAGEICERLRENLKNGWYEYLEGSVRNLVDGIEHFHSLGMKVVDQARRRVLDGEKVPNDEKIFSIFEPHTELLKRGKAGKPIEFGHMVSFYQVEGKFITDYEIFERKPVDYELVDPALKNHRALFGENPKEFAADKGFYESMEKIRELEDEIDFVSICKKGKRSEEEEVRESSKEFKAGQRFRAGIEGTISVLKRALGMFRCRNKSWEHYVSTVGAIVFTHNLLVLARGCG